MRRSADLGAVGVGGVDEIDAQLDRAAQDGDRLAVVGRLAPDAVAGDLHRAEAEPVDGKIAADREGAAPECRLVGFNPGCAVHAAPPFDIKGGIAKDPPAGGSATRRCTR